MHEETEQQQKFTVEPVQHPFEQQIRHLRQESEKMARAAADKHAPTMPRVVWSLAATLVAVLVVASVGYELWSSDMSFGGKVLVSLISFLGLIHMMADPILDAVERAVRASGE